MSATSLAIATSTTKPGTIAMKTGATKIGAMTTGDTSDETDASEMTMTGG